MICAVSIPIAYHNVPGFSIPIFYVMHSVKGLTWKSLTQLNKYPKFAIQIKNHAKRPVSQV